MNVAIVGYGEQGRSAFEYWFNQGHVVVICDQNTDIELPAGAIDKLGPTYLEGLHEFDLIVRSPAVHPNTILEANLQHPEIKDRITTNTNEFFRVCKAPVIGVTGTKGKGTTSTLISRILEAAGKKVHLGGNIGIPPLDLLKNNIAETDIVVLELANFQLIDLKQSPNIAVCLMIVPEHIDWHGNAYSYVDSKKQIFKHQPPSGLAVYNANNVYATELVASSPAHTKISYCVPDEGQSPEFTDGAYVDDNSIKMRGKTVCSVKDVRLLGYHNLQNICAAIAATWDLIDHKADVIKEVVKNFASLPNRLEIVRVLNDVTYYNDSFSAHPGALIAALSAVKQPKVMIIGGFDRMLSLDEMIQQIVKNAAGIRKIIIIGQSAQRIADTLSSNGFSNYLISQATTMAEIVAQANQHAVAGDAMVLSPGFPSFDMFKNFEERGRQFREAVLGL